ncbi:MAG TPA: GDSL-type esterase/lipase family protein [Gemmatimonadaceae bacterium]|nr:GDSL-type esterase/lipase family protein [Gemmatimonadaceae bacterium]
MPLPLRRLRRAIAHAALAVIAPAFASAQYPTNQRLYDTVTSMPDLRASRIAKFEAEPVVTRRVIFLGNSITQGGDWAKLTGDSTVINRGIGADITFGLRSRLADVTRRKPSKLFVLIGINDISKDIPDAVIAAQYRALVDSVKSQSPVTKIFVQSILPLNPSVKNFPQHYDKQERVVAVNRLIRQMARETGATYIDLWPLFVDRQNRLDSSLTGDGLHLNQRGYERWARFLQQRRYLAAAAGGDTVAVWMTSGDKSALLARQPTLTFGKTPSGGPTITVDGATTYQSMAGFGYTLTGGSAYVINRMPASARDALLRELFGRDHSSLGVSYLRLSIGGSDLDAEPFTYDEMPAGQTDPTLASFTIESDRGALLPVLEQILAINPGIPLLATPWTAPRWMKDNGAYVGGSLLPANYPAYAQYFVKYIQAMKAEGMTIAAITVQNEPLHPGNNPSMLMTAAQQATFIKSHLGPALRAAGLETKILLYDHNADHPEYPISILDDPAAKAFVDGSAFHLYGGPIEALTRVHDAHPDRNLYFTEQWTSSTGQFDGDLRWHVKNLVVGAPRNWSRTVLEWNLANDERFGPHTSGGCTTCLGAVTINSSTSAVTRNVAYYIVGHLSRFVDPGSMRVASTVTGGSKSASLPNVAFRTPAGRYVLVVLNDGNATQTFNVGFEGRRVTHSLAVGSVATYVW